MPFEEKDLQKKTDGKIVEEEGIDKAVKKVVERVLKEMEFDLENFLEDEENDLAGLVFETIMSILEDEMPFIEDAFIESEYELESLIDEDGEFILN